MSTERPRRTRRRLAEQAGFTLVEIAVTVLIIAILALIAVPQISKARRTARIKEAEIEIEVLASAVRQLAWDTGLWPGGSGRPERSEELWDLSQPEAGLLATDGTYNGWRGPYLDGVSLDPWGTPYFFDSDYHTGIGVVSVVGSFGPNRAGRNVYDSDDIYVVVQR